MHNLDKMSWVMKDVPPSVAWRSADDRPARRQNTAISLITSGVVYEYAGGARVPFCRQQSNTTPDNSDYVMGAMAWDTSSVVQRARL